MPDFSKPLSTLGGVAGGTAGGLLGGLLGGVSDVLSAPRRLAWKALSAPFGADIESGDDLMQAAGLDTENPLVKALGMGAEVLGDPLTYVGGLGGMFGGAKAARALAPGMEAAAVARGPRYAGGIEKLIDAGVPRVPSANALMEDLQNLPHLTRMLQEVPPGVQYLGHGAEALALKTPAGDVLRLQPGLDEYTRLARPNIPEVLQPSRAGLVGDARIERSPLADTSTLGPTTAQTPVMRSRAYVPAEGRGGTQEIKDQLKAAVSQRGYDPVDVHQGNLGIHEGQVKVIDPGAVLPRAGGPQLPALPDWSAQQPGRLRNWLLDLLGSDQAMQEELARQVARPASLAETLTTRSTRTPTTRRP